MRWIVGLAFLGLSACTTFDRSGRSGYAGDSDEGSAREFYQERMNKDESEAREELGFDNGPLSGRERDRLEERLRLRRMEAAIQSKRDRKQYYSARNLMRSDQERMDFLSLPNYQMKQRWLQTRGLLKDEDSYPESIAKAIEANDIAIGMSQKAVRESWGDPDLVEVAGNPMYGYERWNYHRMIAGNDGYQKELRVIYFEGGRVVGWETPGS